MGPQMSHLRDIAHFVFRSATDLFVYTHAHFILFFSPSGLRLNSWHVACQRIV
jgi:hypothetical protein